MSENTTLPDGRTAKKDKNGRWREAETGVFIPNPAAKHKENQHKKTFLQSFIQAAQKKGHPVTTPEEAFGAIIAVQTEIALDPDNGAKATTAARFIIQATGLLDDTDPADQPETERWVLGKEFAGELLKAIEEEKDSRQ